ncbi:MAG TPA: S8 family serine peptidase, partial [Chloroflexia bacterium]|nr:S8 family serine peptidase [Chloroflexia bacterium]
MRRYGSVKSLILAAFVLAIAVVAGWPAGRAGVQASAPVSPASKIAPQVLADTANGQATAIMILLTDQADLSAAYTMPDQNARGWYVYNTLRTHAAQSQQALRGLLAAQGVPYQSFWAANALAAPATRPLVDTLAARADVRAIESNTPQRWIEDPTIANRQPAPASPATVEWGVQNVNAPAVWALGYTGQGIVIGNADTGMQWDHPALKPHYRGWNGTTADHNYNWHDSIHGVTGNPCGSDLLAPCDDYGHGTHTTGTTSGDDGAGNQIGVAPGALWIGTRNMDQGTGTPARYTESFQWFIAPTDLSGNNPDPTRRPHVINNSWGCPTSEGCAANTLLTIVNNTQAAGIFVEASAGNSGSGCSSVTDPPALYAAAFSTGAIGSTNVLAGFSSRGPVTADGSNRLKPNIAAPGVNVRSAVPGNTYQTMSGTSMAGPHVVGVVALLWSARPQLARDITTTKTILQNTANPNVVVSPVQTCGGISSNQIPNNSFGYGRVDALAAVNSVQPPATHTPTATSTISPPTATSTAPAPTATATAPLPTATATVPATSTAPPLTATPTTSPTATTCAVVVQGAITGTDPAEPDRLSRLVPSSICGVAKPCPGTVANGPYHYRSYTYVNNTGGTACVSVTLDPQTCGNTSAMPLHSSAYLTSFDPNNLCTNYLADIGLSPVGPTTYAFSVPAGATFVVVVNETVADATCPGYTLTVSGLGCGPTPPPTATVPIEPTQTATATPPPPPTASTTPLPSLTSGPPSATATPTVCAVVTQGALTTADPQETLRMFRSDPPSSCGTAKACPGTTNVGPDYYHTYTYVNTTGSAACISVTLDPQTCSGSAGTTALHSSAYLDSFDPASLCFNYLGDIGASPSTSPKSYSFTVPAGHTFVVVVNAVTANATCPGYVLAVAGLGCTTPTATPPPGNTTPTPGPTHTVAPTRTVAPSATPCTLSFTDVHATDYFYTPVLYLACHGVISGYSNGDGTYSFRPYNNTTRSQMVKIVVLGFAKPIVTPAGGNYTFADVPPSNPFFSVIETGAADTIVSGYNCGGPGEPCDSANRPYFRPYANVTRGQLSKIDVVAAGW